MKYNRQILIYLFILFFQSNLFGKDSTLNVGRPVPAFIKNSKQSPRIDRIKKSYAQSYDNFFYFSLRYDRLFLINNSFNNWTNNTYHKNYHLNYSVGFQLGFKKHNSQYGLLNVYFGGPGNNSSDLGTVLITSFLGRTFNFKKNILTIAIEPGYFHAGTRDLDPSNNSWLAINPFDTTRILRYNSLYLGLSIINMCCYRHGPFHTSFEFKVGGFPFGSWKYGYYTNTNTPVQNNTGGVIVGNASDFHFTKINGVPNFQIYFSFGIILSIVKEIEKRPI